MEQQSITGLWYSYDGANYTLLSSDLISIQLVLLMLGRLYKVEFTDDLGNVETSTYYRFPDKYVISNNTPATFINGTLTSGDHMLVKL